ncbi:MAG TPA: CRISPR-associated helicase Cas3' [Pirellulales bacterium]|nr:CRISPR-associated helicase Cas3' [Pirellulales bacterium]
MNQLLAKSPRAGMPDKTLIQHTADVMDAVIALFGTADCPTRLGREWRRFFQLEDFGEFQRATLAAAAFHDIGKANDSFQIALRRSSKQAIRHEHLSGLILGLACVRGWIAMRADIDWEVVLATVASHHLKTQHEKFGAKQNDAPGIRVLSNVSEFQALLQLIAETLGLDCVSFPQIPRIWSFDPAKAFNVTAQAEDVRSQLHQLDRAVAGDAVRRRLMWAVRAGLIAADAVGSAFDRLGQAPKEWLAETFDPRQVCTSESIWQNIIGPRVNELRSKGRWNDAKGAEGWSTFQVRCADQPSRTLLLAPCGSGKTLAAWRWIAGQLAERPAARVIFLYPTRATATEGFRDYVSWAPEDDAALVHGTASYDLAGMFENPADPDDRRQDKQFQSDPRLFAVGLWGRRVFAATVDQFFAFLQYQYGPMCLLPLLVDSVVVVDEIHSFDRSMFSSLKQFLQNFPSVPVLCMTATLPGTRRDQLVAECGMTVYDEKPDDLRQIAELPRYRVERVKQSTVTPRIEAALGAGKRVLCVVNNVRRAQEFALVALRRAPGASQLEAAPGVPLHCYHSRFKLTDRREQHRAVVAAFQGGGGAVLAITTQVCEMSLDLDADVLVTEVAPVTALIQRMGRCVREARPKHDRVGEVLIYSPEDNLPYDQEMLRGAEEFVDELASYDRVSQIDLERALERWAPLAREPDKACSFLESGPYAMARETSFREGTDFTIDAILDADVNDFVAAGSTDKAGFVLPVPRRFATDADPKLPGYLRTAPAENYHPVIGFYHEPVF